MNTNIFLEATRRKLRFQTGKGLLSVEELWDLKLTDLDTAAIAVNKQLKDSKEESFIAVKTKTNTELELRLEILKAIIETKQSEATAKANKAKKDLEREKLIDLLSRKEDSELEQLSPEEIKKRLAELDAEG